MQNKIYEEALASALKRIEVLEEKFELLNKKPFNVADVYPKANNPGQATPGQRKYILALGGWSPIDMTKLEAGTEIDRLLELKKSHSETEVEEPKEVDTEDAGLDGELM